MAELSRGDLGCVLYDTIIIDVAGPVELDLGPPVFFCPGDSAFFSLSGFDAVNWYSLEIGLLQEDLNSIRIPVTGTDTIVAEVIYGNCVQFDSVIVDIHEQATFNLGYDTALCAGEILPLSLEGFETVNWYLNRIGWVASGPEYDHKVSVDEQIVAEGINENGCSAFDTLLIEVLLLPQVDLGTDTAICVGETLRFEIEGFERVSWFLQSAYEWFVGPSFLFESLADDTLVVEVMDGNGCNGLDTLAITVHSLPLVDLGEDLVFCEEENVLLELQDRSFDRVDWFSLSGDSLKCNQWFFTYQATQTDTIVAQITNLNTCINSDTVIVQVNPQPVTQIMDTAVCFGDELLLEVGEHWQEVNWYGEGDILLAGNQHFITFEAMESTEVLVEVIEEGCAGHDISSVTVKPLPQIDLRDTTHYCLGDLIRLDAGNIGVEYAWKNTDSEILSDGQTLDRTAINDDRFYLKVTNEQGCTNEDSTAVIVHALPEFDILGDTEACAGEMVELSVSTGNFSHTTWYRESADILTYDTPNVRFEAGQPETVFVWLKDQNDCISQDSVALTVNISPQADAGPERFICYGEETTLGGDYDQNSDLTFSWEGTESSSIPNLVVSPLESSRFSLTVTNSHDCEATDSVFVEVHPEIIADAGPDMILCEGEEVTIGAPPGNYQYLWTPADGLSSSVVANPAVRTNSDQTYILTVISGDCGPAYDTVLVSVKPAPEIQVSPDRSIGPGESIHLHASGGVNYRWQPADLLDNPLLPDPIALPLSNTLFTVEVENEFGCIGVDSVMVLIQNALFITNLFTPNGDGSNDEFKVYGSGISELRLSIYDLNGMLIHTISNPNEALSRGWDGTRNGSVLPNGSYIWMITGRFHDGSPLEFNGQQRGMVSLMR